MCLTLQITSCLHKDVRNLHDFKIAKTGELSLWSVFFLNNPTNFTIFFYIFLQVKDIERALYDSYQVHPTVYCLPVKVKISTINHLKLLCDQRKLGYEKYGRAGPFSLTHARRTVRARSLQLLSRYFISST